MKQTSSLNAGAGENGAANGDLELVKRSQGGDAGAFEELFNRYHKRIYNYIYQMARNETDAADLTQETFVRVYNSLPHLRAPEAFVSWLHRVALNLCRDHAKRPRPQSLSLDRPLDEDGGEMALEIPDTGDTPEQALEAKELEKRVREAVGGLSPEHRAVVMMHHLEGMELTDIAESMGCSVGTVKSRLARARDALRRKLGGYVEV